MRFGNPYFIIGEKIQLLQRWILVHSMIYYNYDTNIISDEEYDKNCRQLKFYMQKYPEIETKYSYIFDYEWRGYTLDKAINKKDKQNILRDVQILLRGRQNNEI